MKKTLLYFILIISMNLNASEFSKAKKDCRANNAKECHHLAVLYYQKKDNTNALKFSDKSCNLGYARGCVGSALVAKELGEIDKQEDYLIKACDELGSGLGCGVLGFLYYNRNEVEKSMTPLQKACNSTDNSLGQRERVEACEKVNTLTQLQINREDIKYKNCLKANKFELGTEPMKVHEKCEKESKKTEIKKVETKAECMKKYSAGTSFYILEALCKDSK